MLLPLLRQDASRSALARRTLLQLLLWHPLALRIRLLRIVATGAPAVESTLLARGAHRTALALLLLLVAGRMLRSTGKIRLRRRELRRSSRTSALRTLLLRRRLLLHGATRNGTANSLMRR
jgi:hypothetical protein